jgi:hypothetical protein
MPDDRSLKPEEFPVQIQQGNIVKNDGKAIGEASRDGKSCRRRRRSLERRGVPA